MRCKKCRKEMQRVRFGEENIFYYHCYSCGYDFNKPNVEDIETKNNEDVETKESETSKDNSIVDNKTTQESEENGEVING